MPAPFFVEAALALLAPPNGQRPGDEIDRLVTSLRDLAGRQAGLEAEGRWLRHASGEMLSAKTTALDNLCRAAKLLGESDISELHALSALGILEQTLQARTVGLRLTQTVRIALAAPEILSTRGAPELLRETTAEPVGAEITARLLPARDALPGAGDREVVGDAELMRRRVEQPVADLAILLRAMKRLLRARGRCDQSDEEEPLHGSLLATIFTGN